jgi:hypothetical protein
MMLTFVSCEPDLLNHTEETEQKAIQSEIIFSETSDSQRATEKKKE